MLTVDYERLGAAPGDRVLDLGCGAGRHAFESARRGCITIASDRDHEELRTVAATFAAMRHPDASSAADAEKGATLAADTQAGATATAGADTGATTGADAEAPSVGEADSAESRAFGGPDAAAGAQALTAVVVTADATALPYSDNSFDRVIAAEVLEHIDDDEAAIAELARVLRPGGTIAVTVPARLGERVCWALSSDYHAPAVPDGHVRIYRSGELRKKLADVGLAVGDSHGAHGLHTPYWWLRCLVGPRNDSHRLVAAYHRLLVWDITQAPTCTRKLDRLLSAVLPKSLVLYAHKAPAGRPAGSRVRRRPDPAGNSAASPARSSAAHAG